MLLNFPTKGVRTDVLSAQLNQRVDVLEEYYKCLDEVHTQLNDLEAELSRLENETMKLEEAFDVVLTEYVPLVGDNLDIHFLHYSRKAIVVADGDRGITIQFGETGKKFDMEFHGGEE
jgi:hypothetical protein